MSEDGSNSAIVPLTINIVMAYVTRNTVTPTELPGLISSIHRSLTQLNGPATSEQIPLVPSVPINKSVFEDYIICLEDGKKFKSLKRHLATHFKLTPEEYRAKWNLPPDYPMVAPSYAAARSALAKTTGLGRKRAPAAEPASGPAPAKRGRAKKAAAEPKRRGPRQPAEEAG